MKSLKFKRLSILSTTEEKGGYYEFGENLNLITSDSNSYGKSAIIKMLLWTLGCEPFFDDDWKNLKCKSIVSFTILETTFTFQRILNSVWIQVNDNSVEFYDKITGDYSSRFAEIVNFPALLPSYSNRLEVPPPAYYFTPFYIEQWKGWVSSFINFENLTQYPNWEKPIIQTHVGILKKEYYDLEIKINEKKFEKENQKNMLISMILR
ncbi:hypothetical protein BWI96_20870 [Siphonobacter sp. SORGH_AS_0500]|uniref:hypothetical protein n=1 Tax=Siphonobacter sp. SORGH_AS_0500 TaxID=1864824 RepID=UPI000CC9570A|nr:hypothetical protein [Siphonobacter sp. SORGH_AS_0500]PKK34682.1 hypothetical protein BWI96_20870 [Siphonobacter sp. SORGH_AS_0500]